MDIDDYYQLFNGQIYGRNITTMKITISQDRVDSGRRKIVEEIVLDKFNDYEVFSLSQVVNKLREKLEKDIYLRVHLINNISYEDI